MGVIRAVLMVLFLASLGVASNVLFPIERVEVVGNYQLSATEVQKATGLEVGRPWLWAWDYKLRELAKNPWVKEVQLQRPALGQVRIVLRERTQVANIVRDGVRYGLSSDGVLLPNAAFKTPVLEGKGRPNLPDLMALIATFPQAKQIRYDSSGYQILEPNLNIWSANVRDLQRWAKARRIGKSEAQALRSPLPQNEGGNLEKLYVYSWGVSTRR